MPVLVEDDCAAGVAQFLVIRNHVERLFGDAVVEFATGVVKFVDVGGQLEGVFMLFGEKQAH